MHTILPGLWKKQCWDGIRLQFPSQREAEQFVLQVAFVGVWRKVGAAHSRTFALKGVQALARHHPFVSDTFVLGELVVYHTGVLGIWAVSHSTDCVAFLLLGLCRGLDQLHLASPLHRLLTIEVPTYILFGLFEFCGLNPRWS